MSAASKIARPLLASMFIDGGIDAVRNPASKVKAAEKFTAPLSRRVGALPEDPVVMVRLNGGVQAVAGALLAIGKFRRIAALALVGSVIPTTYAGHQFWNEIDEEKRSQQQIHFLKNLGLLGGLILAATDTEGAPSVVWKVQRYRQTRKARHHHMEPMTHNRFARLAHDASGIGSRAWLNFEGAAAKEVAMGADLTSRVGNTGIKLGEAVRSHIQERIAAQ